MPTYNVEMSVPVIWRGWATLMFEDVHAATPKEAEAQVRADFDGPGNLDYETLDDRLNASEYGASSEAVIHVEEVEP